MLAIVALAMMGGSFNLDLVIGQQREGVLLPAAANPVADASSGQAPVPSPTKGTDLRVLYVEDNAVNAEVMAAMLRDNRPWQETAA